jgi:hypothetical protein
MSIKLELQPRNINININLNILRYTLYLLLAIGNYLGNSKPQSSIFTHRIMDDLFDGGGIQATGPLPPNFKAEEADNLEDVYTIPS